MVNELFELQSTFPANTNLQASPLENNMREDSKNSMTPLSFRRRDAIVTTGTMLESGKYLKDSRLTPEPGIKAREELSSLQIREIR